MKQGHFKKNNCVPPPTTHTQANKSLIYQTANFISECETYPLCPQVSRECYGQWQSNDFWLITHLQNYKKHYKEKISEVAEAIMICEDPLSHPASLGRAFPCPRKTEPLWIHLHPLYFPLPPTVPTAEGWQQAQLRFQQVSCFRLAVCVSKKFESPGVLVHKSCPLTPPPFSFTQHEIGRRICVRRIHQNL